MPNKQEQHSPMYEKLYGLFEKGYVTKETLQGWVVLHAAKPTKGISESEYEVITGDKYVA